MAETPNPSNAEAPAETPVVDPADAALNTETVISAAGERPAEAKPDGEKPAAEADAKPVAPEAYELKAPEGTTIDAKALEAVTPVFKNLNLTNEQAQSLTDAYAKDVLPGLVSQIQTAQQQALISDIVKTRKDWADQFGADAEIGGTDEERGQKLSVMAKAIDDIMGAKGTKEGDEFRALMNETGLGNNPVIGRLLYRVGTKLAEAQVHHSNAATAGKQTPAQKFYDEAYQPKGNA